VILARYSDNVTHYHIILV